MSLIWGVGKSFQEKLAKDGIHTIGQLQNMEEIDLTRKYGAMGQRLARLSRGKDSRVVVTNQKAKSVGSETTFNTDIADFKKLSVILRRHCEILSRRLKKSETAGRTVVLKLRTQDFKLLTRNRQLQDPTQLADRIYTAGRELLKKEANGRRFRLLGIAVNDLYVAENADPDSLVDHEAVKRAQAERAIDKLRNKFGNESVELGLTFSDKQPKKATKR